METINKAEILKTSKWVRFLFMVLYAFVINFALTIDIGLACIQFLCVLFTSKVNISIANINSYIIEFFDDSRFRVRQWWYLMPPHLRPGINNAESARLISKHSDAVVVGSSIIKVIENNLNKRENIINGVSKIVNEIRTALD